MPITTMKQTKPIYKFEERLYSELAVIIWMSKFDLLPVISYSDFYKEFAIFVEKVENVELNEKVHKDKI